MFSEKFLHAMNSLVDIPPRDKLEDPNDAAKFATYVHEALTTCCVRCDARRNCEFAYSLYNTDCEPQIDCLAAK